VSFKMKTAEERAYMACGPTRVELFQKIESLSAENKSLREQRDELISIADHYTEFGMSEILELAGIDDTVSTQQESD